LDSFGSEEEPLADSYGSGNELSRFIKFGEVLDYLSDFSYSESTLYHGVNLLLRKQLLEYFIELLCSGLWHHVVLGIIGTVRLLEQKER
jgi:hypothetical protein